MWQTGDKVWYWLGDERIACVVTSTFYEPGDPIQGVNMVSEDRTEAFGGVDSQDCTPREDDET